MAELASIANVIGWLGVAAVALVWAIAQRGNADTNRDNLVTSLAMRNETRLDKLQTENAELKEQAFLDRQRISVLENNETGWQTEKTRYDTRIAALEKELTDLKAYATKQQTLIDNLQAIIDKLQTPKQET